MEKGWGGGLAAMSKLYPITTMSYDYEPILGHTQHQGRFLGENRVQNK